MPILNNQREIKTWLSETHPQRVEMASVNFLLQQTPFDGAAALRTATVQTTTNTPKSTSIPVQILQPATSKPMEPPSRNIPLKSGPISDTFTARSTSETRPAGNVSKHNTTTTPNTTTPNTTTPNTTTPNTITPIPPPKPSNLANSITVDPFFCSTQFSDFSDPPFDDELIDTHLLGIPKLEAAESRSSKPPNGAETYLKRSAETKVSAVKKQRSSAQNSPSEPVPEVIPPSNPDLSDLNAGQNFKTQGIPKSGVQTSISGKSSQNSGKNNQNSRPNSHNSIKNIQITGRNSQITGKNTQNASQNSQQSVPLLQEYIRMCEAKIHLLTKCNAVNDSTSLSLDAKKLWQQKQFEPRLKQLDISLSKLRPNLTFLDPLPLKEDLSNISESSPAPGVQDFPLISSLNVLEELKVVSSAPNSSVSPYFVHTRPKSTGTAPSQTVSHPTPDSQPYKSPEGDISGKNLPDMDAISDIQVPDSLPTPSYTSNIQEARQIIMQRRNQVDNGHISFSESLSEEGKDRGGFGDKPDSGVNPNLGVNHDILQKNPAHDVSDDNEDNFGDGFMAGLESSQIDNEDTDLSGFIARDEAEDDDLDSIDESYTNQPTQFNHVDTEDDEEVVESSGSEDELAQIRLSQDVAQRLGVSYSPGETIEILDEQANGNENEGNGENESADFTTQLNEGRDEIVEIPSEDDLDDDDLDGLKELSVIKTEQPDNLHVISDSDFSDNDDELIQLSKTVGLPSGIPNEPFLDEVYRILRTNFRLSEFRSNQLEAIVATLKGKDVFVLIPTGGGKSLCFQLPALVKGGRTRGTTVVVSPLISLMQDQVQHLQAKNIRAGMISSKGTADERNTTFKALTSGQLDLVYLSPEMINNSGRVQKVISKLHENSMLARVVVDEAHCVSSWGHDFRPDYKGMSFFKQNFPDVPIMALTATANEKVRLDIVHNLQMHDPVLLKQSFNRVNLMYEVKNKPPNIYDWIRDYIGQKQRGKTGIIYCHSKQSCETTAQKLNDAGVRCMFYHAGMDPTDRFSVQEKWQTNEIQVICATIAFGMGIDKPDVRFVIHLYIPRSLEGYYQETGRAGRDGNPSECIMFYSYKDARALQSLIQRDDKLEDSAREAHLTKLQQVVQYCENKTDCRRQQVLHFFNETFDPVKCKKMCDNCCSNVVAVTRDVTDHCVAITKLVQSLQADKVTIIHCQDVYKGAKHGKILKQNHHMNPYHGKGKGLDRGDIERIFYHLQSEGGLLEYQVMRGGFATTYVKLGPRANVIMKGTQRIQLSFTEKESTRGKGSKGSRTDNGTGTGTTNGTGFGTGTGFGDLNSLRYTESFVSARDLNNPGGSSGSFGSGTSSFSRISLPEQNFGGQVTESNSQMINHAFTELRNFRAQKSQEMGFGRAHYFISDALLKEMALKLPTNAVDFAKLDAMTKEKVPFFQHFKKLLGSLSRSRKKAEGGTVGSASASGSGTLTQKVQRAQKVQRSQRSSKSSRSQNPKKRVPKKNPSSFRPMPI